MRLFITTLGALLLAAPVAFADTHEAASESSPSTGTPDVAAMPPLAPQTQNGVTFVTGGAGDREQAQLGELDADYNVRLAFTRADGAYLAGVDVDVTVEDREGKALIETTAGPILLAQLEPGRYHVSASVDGRTTEKRVIDVPKDRDQVNLFVALEEIE